jgi:Fe-S cluster biogenesis protein NfuA
MSRLGPAIAFIGIWVLLVTCSGCGSSDQISARETERQLKRASPNRMDVKCVSADGVYWDYTCQYSILVNTRKRTETIDVRVDEKQITDQTAP